MSNEIVKFSNQFNNVALKKFDAVHLDVLMAIASRVREKGTATVEFSFEELRGLMRLRKNLTNKQLADKIVQTNARLLALNYMFEDSGKIIQFALFTVFETDPANQTLEVSVNERFAFLLNDLTSQFTRFELAEFADLKSKYAKEFYRRAKQYRSSGIWKVSREEFCRLLGVPKATAESTTNFNKKVLKPILDECGPLLRLKIERQYTRRRLSGFVFTFARETAPVIDHRSFKARGIERIPTIHEGYASREMEKRGGRGDLCEENRRIQALNRLLDALRAMIGRLSDQAQGILTAVKRRQRPSGAPQAPSSPEPAERPQERPQARETPPQAPQEPPKPIRTKKALTDRFKTRLDERLAENERKQAEKQAEPDMEETWDLSDPADPLNIGMGWGTGGHGLGL